MFFSRRVLSFFIGWYVLALVVAAVPRPAAIEPVEPVRHAPYDAIAGRLTPGLDAAANIVSRVGRTVSASLSPIRPVTGDVLAQSGMSQRWDMFANPLQNAQYLRVKWYVAAIGNRVAARPSWSGTQLVLPTSREDRVRGVASFRNFSLDRPMAGVIDREHPSGNPDDTDSLRHFEESMRPAIRYLTTQFQRMHLGPDERVVRIEAWHGVAPIDPPSAAGELAVRLATRQQSLRNYYDGIIEEPVINTAFPPYYAVQTESDIRWTLEYIESR